MAGVVAAPFGMFQVEMETRKKNVGFGLSLRHGDSGLKASNERESISPILHFVDDGGDKNVHLRARRKHGTEVERRRQNTDYADGLVIERDGFADDAAVGCELTTPEGVTKKHDRAAIFAALIGSKGAAQSRLDVQGRKEIAHNINAGDGQGIATACELGIVGSSEGEVTGDVLEGTILAKQFIVGVY
jgi:hypothetical protein